MTEWTMPSPQRMIDDCNNILERCEDFKNSALWNKQILEKWFMVIFPFRRRFIRQLDDYISKYNNIIVRVTESRDFFIQYKIREENDLRLHYTYTTSDAARSRGYPEDGRGPRRKASDSGEG